MENENLHNSYQKQIIEEWETPKNSVVVMYFCKTSKSEPLWTVAKKMAQYASEGLEEKISPNILNQYEIDSQSGIITVGFPIEMFDFSNTGISSFLSIIAGWNISVKGIKQLRVIDVLFPKKVHDTYKSRIRKKPSIEESIKENSVNLHVPIYPRCGISKKNYYEKIKFLINHKKPPDFIDESELLFNKRDCKVKWRIKKIKKLLDQKSGRKPTFLINLSPYPSKMVELSNYCNKFDNIGISINALTVGLPVIEEIRKKYEDLLIFIHANMHPLFTRGGKNGIEYPVLFKTLELIGGDIIYAGCPWGNLDQIKPVQKRILQIQKCCDMARSGRKSTSSIPWIGGGINLGNIEINLRLSKWPTSIVVGGGVWNCKNGPNPNEAISLLKTAIDIITENKKYWTESKKFKNIRKKYPKYFKKTYIDTPHPMDEDLKGVLKNYGLMKND